MPARSQQSYTRPVVKAIAEGATTPNPGVVNAVVLSTTTGSFLRWDGAAWVSVHGAGFAAHLKFGVD